MAEIIVPVNGGMFDSTEIIETVGGFPRGNKAVDAAFFAKMISCFYKDGVWRESSFVPSAKNGMTIKIGGGIAWIRGYMAWQENETALTLASGTNYAITLRLNIAEGQFYIFATTQPNTVPQRTENVVDLVLAEVSIPAGAVEITGDMITDTRGDTAKCGYVSSAVEVLDIIDNAQNANMLGGEAADKYLKKSGGSMTGPLRAASVAGGASAVRNIGYGYTVPETLADGDLFILIQ